MFTQNFFNLHIYEVIGMIGFCLYVFNYSMLSLGLLSGNALRYFVLNLAAASCVMVGLMHSFNMAAALIQGFWITMSILAIVIRLMRKERDARQIRRANKRETAFT